MNKRISNIIGVKFREALFSTAIKIMLMIILIYSIAISFLPYIKKNFFNDAPVSVGCNVSLDSMEDDNFILVDYSNKCDLKVTFEDNKYFIDINSREGYDKLNYLLQKIHQINYAEFIKENKISGQQYDKLLNNNIIINDVSDEIIQVNSEVMDFLIMVTIPFYLILITLVSRIGAQVAYEKGSKVTEVILTAVSEKQLFFCNVISSMLITVVSLLIVMAPMVAAYVINDPTYTSDFSFFTTSKLIYLLIHLTFVCISLIMLSIAISSIAKQPEDANIFAILSMAPLFISYTYFMFKIDLYKGVFTILNYVPIFSAFPVVSAILNDGISITNLIFVFVSNIIFIILEYLALEKVYCSNISNI
ncbi:ABC transporter permease [Lachnoclostridium phytofermentans]|nr:ABC transporter permease [Lachnoclostridium phytofermentans]